MFKWIGVAALMATGGGSCLGPGDNAKRVPLSQFAHRELQVFVNPRYEAWTAEKGSPAIPGAYTARFALAVYPIDYDPNYSEQWVEPGCAAPDSATRATVNGTPVALDTYGLSCSGGSFDVAWFSDFDVAQGEAPRNAAFELSDGTTRMALEVEGLIARHEVSSRDGAFPSDWSGTVDVHPGQALTFDFSPALSWPHQAYHDLTMGTGELYSLFESDGSTDTSFTLAVPQEAVAGAGKLQLHADRRPQIVQCAGGRGCAAVVHALSEGAVRVVKP